MVVVTAYHSVAEKNREEQRSGVESKRREEKNNERGAKKRRVKGEESHSSENGRGMGCDGK